MQGLGSVLETQDEISARPELTAITKQQNNSSEDWHRLLSGNGEKASKLLEEQVRKG